MYESPIYQKKDDPTTTVYVVEVGRLWHVIQRSSVGEQRDTTITVTYDPLWELPVSLSAVEAESRLRTWAAANGFERTHPWEVPHQP